MSSELIKPDIGLSMIDVALSLGITKPASVGASLIEEPSVVPLVGALVQLDSDITNWSTSADNYQPLDFDSATYDTSGFWDAGNPERLTIPPGSGITRVKLFGSVVFDWGNDSDHGNISISHFDSSDVQKLFAASGLIGSRRSTGSNQNPGARQTTPRTETPWIEVEEGDYFVLVAGHGGFQASSSVDVKANVTNFGIVDFDSYSGSFAGIKRARVSLSSNQVLSAVDTDQKVALDSVDFDEHSLWDADNNRFVVPDGASYARLIGVGAVEHDIDIGRWKLCRIYKNGGASEPGMHELVSGGSNVEDQVGGMPVDTAWMPVSEGDYFELYVACEAAAAGPQVVKADTTYLSIEVW